MAALVNAAREPRRAGSTPVVEATGITIDYGSVTAVRSVDVVVEAGERVALLGPSGAGKTTLLYALAGFLPLAAGEVRMGGTTVSVPGRVVPPEDRPIAMVFQHYGLWPHLDAVRTVAYPLRRAGTGRVEADRQARELLSQMGIGHLAGRRPAELSGGEQQRVGLARALARRPAVYLLDEPTAHLDSELKADLQAELAQRVRADGAAAIHATHDVEEALAVADRVVLMRGGAVVQTGEPSEIYARPVDEWAARLTGPASFVEGAFEAPGSTGAGRYLVRPDWAHLDGDLEAQVDDVRFRGTHTDYRLRTNLGPVLVRELGPARLAVGAATSVGLDRVWRMAPPSDDPAPPML